MKSPNTPDKRGGVSLRLVLGIALALIPLALIAQQQGPSWWYQAYPAGRAIPLATLR